MEYEATFAIFHSGYVMVSFGLNIYNKILTPILGVLGGARLSGLSKELLGRLIMR